MIRTLRLLMMVALPGVILGVPAGYALGAFATGETLYSYNSGTMLPEEGANLRSADNADAVQPAAVAYAQHDRYADAAAHWIN
ncbi:hypothetical protein [uncultured Sphingomonas sp.]|uniref:hypothetical protein n=1 Tax=uncultured Sphingomonas sp. TaxID=158754 RepID=UPI0025E381D0|nr:hypothetical protein [uncultured Sphingomonas sp.]